MNNCQLAFVERQPIDIGKAIRQHVQYEACLASLGIAVVSLPAVPDQPDAVFVEDPAIVLDEVAIMTRMGAESRRGESASLAEAIARFRPLRWIAAPGTLEGGDVVRIGPRCSSGGRHGATTRALLSWHTSWRHSGMPCGRWKCEAVCISSRLAPIWAGTQSWRIAIGQISGRSRMRV